MTKEGLLYNTPLCHQSPPRIRRSLAVCARGSGIRPLLIPIDQATRFLFPIHLRSDLPLSKFTSFLHQILWPKPTCHLSFRSGDVAQSLLSD
jgi:hypothetical protein